MSRWRVSAKGGGPVCLAVAGGAGFLLASCGHVLTQRSSYGGEAGAEVSGALVRSAVKPLGGQSGFALSAGVYTAGSGTLNGPFLWRIEAQGDDGYHREMTVHRVKVETSLTGRQEWYPQDLLGKTVQFYPVKGSAGEVFAQYQIPGELEVYPSEDGEIAITVDLTIRTAEETIRRMLRFRMKPQESRDLEFMFLPADFVSGSSQDPKEWSW